MDIISLTTKETQYLRDQYPCIEHLEAGNVGSWLVERREQLLGKAEEERLGMNIVKTFGILATTAGALCYATSPLAPIGGIIAAIGYGWAVIEDMNASHKFAPLPFIRGNFIEFLSAIGDRSEREKYFASQNAEVELLLHLDPFEQKEYALLLEFMELATEYLMSVEPGKRFYAYRWLLGKYRHYGTLPEHTEMAGHLENVELDPRIEVEAIGQLQDHSRQKKLSLIEQQRARCIKLPNQPRRVLPEEVIKEEKEAVEDLPQPDEQPPEASQSVTPEPPSSTPFTTKLPDLPSRPAEAQQPTTPVTQPPEITSRPVSGIDLLDGVATSRRSTLLIGDTGAGKSVTEAYIVTRLLQLYPDADIRVLAQKADSFCGLADQGRVTLFDPVLPDEAIALIDSIWRTYDKRRRLKEAERPALPPVRLILADWLSINHALDELKGEEPVKGSRYLTKLADIIYNGRELNVCLLVDLQSYNLAALGLRADRNSRKNFNLIGLGNYSIDELGMVNESYGVLINLIGDHHIVASETERAALLATFNELHPLSKKAQRPIIFSGLTPARLALLPDLMKYKGAVAVKPIEAEAEAETEVETEQVPKVETQTDGNTYLKFSDDLPEPLKTIYLHCKEVGDWVTVRDIQRKCFGVLKGKSVKNIRHYFGLLVDRKVGEIDDVDGDKPKSDSSVGFRAY